MESEKVKEIKKALECCSSPTCTNDCPLSGCHSDDYKTLCRDKLVKDCLTLINELESENERLKTSEFNSCQELDNACTQIHSLENRIYELEYGIAKSMLGCEFLPECTNEKLKQFAEMLKEKFNDTEYRAKTKRKTISIEELKAQMEWILHEVVIKNIDETLKEFLKGENNE